MFDGVYKLKETVTNDMLESVYALRAKNHKILPTTDTWRGGDYDGEVLFCSENGYSIPASFVEPLLTEEASLTPKAVKSDGGSSSYYDLKLSDLTLDFIEETNKVKTEHLIRDVFGNDFDFGNIFKSLVRAHGTTQGAGKEGNDIVYEMNKIIYSANKLKDYYVKVGS